MPRKKKNEKAVVVTTKHKGVFFGYAEDVEGETIFLRASRLCLYWSEEVKGFGGLGVTGPIGSSRVGPPIDIQLRDITSVVFCTPEATKKWEEGPWK